MKPLAIGITCHPGLGGSGVVATQIGHALALRGHSVHFVCTDAPARLHAAEDVHLHLAKAPDYPVFDAPPYPLALTSKLVTVAREQRLDLIHAHYAVPHAASAWMARSILGGRLKLVTTLHGTDITLIGADPGYLPVVRHCIQQSDAVTAPSRFLRAETHARFDLQTPIGVIPNFVDTTLFHPLAGAPRRLPALFGNDDPVLVHVSNFRPVKRVDAVVAVFAKVLARRPVNLLLIGDGPERGAVATQAAPFGARVHLTGRVDDLAPTLREGALLLFPSRMESFGLAALEAMASGVPVIGSAVGGLPEVVVDGEGGWLVDPDDLDAMADAALTALAPEAHAALAQGARAAALRFREDAAIDAYEALYREVLG